MRHTLRPYATVGVTMVGAGLFAATPVAAPLPDINTFREVALTADDTGLSGLLTPWIDQYNTAAQNATTLTNNFFLAPGVGLQQMIANMSGYLQSFFNDPTSSTVANISAQMQANLAAVLTGYGLTGASADTVTSVTEHTLDGGINFSTGVVSHSFLYQEIGSFLPASVNPATVMPIIDFLSSPLSGIIMGELGPALSPWIALMNSVSDGDGFNQTLANMVGAFFNGADLNLNSLIPTIEQAGIFPAGMNIENLDIAFGGLLTPGTVAVGPYQVLGSGGDVAASVPAVGGSILNSVGITLTGVPVLGNLILASQAVGPIAASEAWGQTVGALLGSGWDGKNTPVDVTPPLAGVTFPTIPSDFFDDGGTSAAAATDSLSWLQDLVAAL